MLKEQHTKYTRTHARYTRSCATPTRDTYVYVRTSGLCIRDVYIKRHYDIMMSLFQILRGILKILGVVINKRAVINNYVRP